MNTGGPAFPMPMTMMTAEHIANEPEYGMTLRDYFAAKAMQGLLAANPETTNKLIVATKGSGSVSELAYVVADAMLKAREK